MTSSRLGSTAVALLLAVVAVLGSGCRKAAETDPAADITLMADQQKAVAARDAALQECESLPGAAKEDCRSVAGAEYERLMSEAQSRSEDAKP